MCGRVENALALEGESRVLNGHKEWPENILQALVNATISEIVLVTGLISKKIKLQYAEKFSSFCSCCLCKEEIETSVEKE